MFACVCAWLLDFPIIHASAKRENIYKHGRVIGKAPLNKTQLKKWKQEEEK